MSERTIARLSCTSASIVIATILTLSPISINSVANCEAPCLGFTDAGAADTATTAKQNKRRAKKRRQIRQQKKRQTKREQHKRRQLIARCRAQTDMTDPMEIKKAIKECIDESEAS